MKIKFTFNSLTWVADLKKGHPISIPLRDGINNPNCFWAPPVSFEPLKAGDFIGSVVAGAPVNFFNVHFNPHGNGTHTECVGHITDLDCTVNRCLREHHFLAKLVTIWPTLQENGDRVITKEQLQEALQAGEAEALVIRTMPNPVEKLSRNYSGTNPPYLATDACGWLVDAEIEHLLLDLPSVDREEDGGAMAAHKAWWRFPEATRIASTITELVYVPDRIVDGHYLLNLQVAPFELDAAPSRPMLYPLLKA
jgi:kynurenine formamidase